MPPNYTKIYLDIVKYKGKEELLTEKLKQKIQNLKTVKDILTLEKELFGTAPCKHHIENQKLRCYDEATILQFLKEQKIHNLNNSTLAKKYHISRNTVSKWKKNYIINI
ncbi:helix-turn-helix domain-containing protein [Chryseobacterium sp. MIQD13]|uniref:helix-turn-helix domain-containing protein n=1 Tax=Chryseobacterium sp. MIQD13 TaxID=3422310 RepID=UPI003D2CFBE7